jgi:hypothetical protein
MTKTAPNFAGEFFDKRGKMRTRRRKSTVPFVETPLTKTGKTKGNPFRNTRSGARADLGGLVVRSNWEANVIRVLNLFDIHFKFEPITFNFPPTPSGKRSGYIPDIYLPHTDEFIEVKGYLDGAGRQKIRKFRKHFPTEFAKLTVIISKNNKANQVFFQKMGVSRILYYEHISELYADKVNWEGVR